jgi:shikimate kinase/3-dehydroquinate synthase
MNRDCVLLWGMPGSGKTSVGKACADLLGWRFVDLDEEIVRSEGRSIAEIFRTDGEAWFRARERDLLRDRLGVGVVISVGGGALLDASFREEISPNACVVVLQASCSEICRRIEESRDIRPLLAGGDLQTKVEMLWRDRSAAYLSVELQVETTQSSVTEVASQVLSKVFPEESWEICLGAKSHRYHLGTGNLATLGDRLKALGASGKVYVCSDRKVWKHHGALLRRSLQQAGLGVSHMALPAGEACKTEQWLWKLLKWLSESGAERSSVLVGFGGGATTDLAGLAASLYMRGMRLALVPTTSLAMLDAAIGGKTAINSGSAKNIYGSFYAPHMVLADTCVLRTLPKRELHASLAEAVKCALIGDAALLALLHERAEKLQHATTLSHATWRRLISASARLKTTIVAEDPTEQGRRRMLNLGHTLGHAIELESGLRHGEAISIGLHAALWLSARRGLCEESFCRHTKELLERLGLPTVLYTPISQRKTLKLVQKDKKKEHGALRFLLPVRVGEVQEVQDVLVEEVEQVLGVLTRRA